MFNTHHRTFKSISSIFFGIAIFFLPFVFPPIAININIAGSLVAATSTLFAIIAGFFIADSLANYLRLQTLIADENAALITIADYAQKVDEKNYKAVHKAIDEYMIAQLDAGTFDHFSLTQKQVDNIEKVIHSLSVDQNNALFYDHILAMEEKFMTCRQEVTLTAKKSLSWLHWSTLITLAVLVIITVLGVRDGTWLVNVISGFMVVGTAAIMRLLYYLDNNTLLEKKLAYKNPRQVFHAISQPPYYPYFSEKKLRIPDADGRLRVGSK